MLHLIRTLMGSTLLLLQTAPAPEPAPSGRLFEGLKDQFTIVLPDGWTAHDQTAVITGKPSRLGMVFFSAEPLTAPGEKTPNLEALRKVDSGEVESFFVDRHPAPKRSSCSQLGRGARESITAMVGGDAIFGGTASRMFAPNLPKTESIELAGCQALKVDGSGRVGQGKTEWRLRVRAVSDGEVLYLFSLRNKAEHFADNLQAFETALATLRLAGQ